MLMSRMLHHLLLAGTCLCIYGNPVYRPNFSSQTSAGSTDGRLSDGKPVGGPLPNIGAGETVASHGRKSDPEGKSAVTQAENGDSFGGKSGLSLTDRDAHSQSKDEEKAGGASRMSTAQKQSEEKGSVLATTGETKLSDMVDTSAKGMTAHGFEELSQLETYSLSEGLGQVKQKEDKDTTAPADDKDGDSIQSRDTETVWPTSTKTPDLSVQMQRVASSTGFPLPSVFFSPRTSTFLSTWGHEAATLSTPPDPLIPDIGPNLMPKEDGPESRWTETVRPSGMDTVVPLSQEEATEGTMSSEALPLIFEPFEDSASEGPGAEVTPLSGSAPAPTAMVTEGTPLSEADLISMETDSDGPARSPPMLVPGWTSSWQTSGAGLLDPNGQSGPPASQHHAGTESGLLDNDPDPGTVQTPNIKENLSIHGPSVSSILHASATVTMATRRPAHNSGPGFEEMESEEETDDDDDDDDEDDEDNSEESMEESDEDLAEIPQSSSTQPPYSLIPPPPVWVQRNQGLMRSWVELIREKAGYVSGMLAPVGIGIAGALLIVGALYSIRMIHRKRRNSFKHQRRKVRQPEQPCEPGTSRQDQAMLLADSSEDEF